MRKTVLVIDDVKVQAEGLSKGLSKILENFDFIPIHEEGMIIPAVEDKYYDLAIVDLRMDKYQFDGITIIEKIIEYNPFAKIIVVSAFTTEYFPRLKKLLLSGKILDVQEKSALVTWLPHLADIISDYFQGLQEDPSEISNALKHLYVQTKNETDTYRKGQMFEHFISLLFGNIGYKEITLRNRDQSSNEIDLIVRNETDDVFLNKFGKYILIECKNKPDERVGKNDFIVFKTKLDHTNGLAELGFLITTGYIARTTYLEAMRGSDGNKKIVFLSNTELLTLISSKDRKEDLKRIIDSQVKDN